VTTRHMRDLLARQWSSSNEDRQSAGSSDASIEAWRRGFATRDLIGSVKLLDRQRGGSGDDETLLEGR